MRIAWNKKEFKIENGYKIIGEIQEHRLIWEQEYNACLLPKSVVHHKDGNKLNNVWYNLQAMTRRTHNFIHKPRIDMSKRSCSNCGSFVTRIYKHKNGLVYQSWYYDDLKNLLCRNCYRKIKA